MPAYPQALTTRLDAQAHALSRVFESFHDLLVVLDDDDNVVAASPSLEKFVGAATSELLGKSFESLLLADDRPAIAHELGEARLQDAAHRFEAVARRHDGSLRNIAWSAAAAPDDRRLHVVGQDMTERRQAEQRLVRAQRLEAVGRLTGGVAHDFNNILAAMMGYLEAARTLPTDPSVERLLDASLEAGRRGARVVAQLLSFARKQEISVGPVDLNRLVSDLESLIAHTGRSDITVDCRLAPRLRPVLGDATQLEMAILNLSLNARDAMPQGGRLTIHTRQHRVTSDERTHLDDLREGNYAVLSVSDDGIGMDDETLARCLEPFFTTKGAGRGTGLGLSQAFGIAQHCGGLLRVRSAQGQGTTVEMILPEAPPAAPAPGSAERPAQAARPPVLLVDRDAESLSTMSSVLQAAGYEPFSVADGSAAMAVLLAGWPIEAIVTAFHLDGGSGLQVLHEAHRLRPTLGGIVIVAEPQHVREVEESSAGQVLDRSAIATTLPSAVADEVARHRRLRDASPKAAA